VLQAERHLEPARLDRVERRLERGPLRLGELRERETPPIAA
jgi:hypothetical protein